MAILTRSTHIRRIKARADPDNPTGHPADPDVWVEFERIDSWIVETGKGPSFVRSIWTFDWSALEAVEDTADIVFDRDITIGTRFFRWIKIKNPDDDTQFVATLIPSSIAVETGKGPSFRRSIWTFDNSADNDSREVRIDRIYHMDDVTNPSSPVDRGQHVDCEVPLSFTVTTGRGPSFQRSRYTPVNDQLPGTRATIG